MTSTRSTRGSCWCSFAHIAPALTALGTALVTSLLPAAASAQVSGGWLGNSAFGAIVAGHNSDGVPLIVCRSNDSSIPGQQPGKTRLNLNKCLVPYGNSERTITQYQALTPTWRANTTEGGFFFGTDTDGTSLSVCHAAVNGGQQVGKQRFGENACLIPYGGTELTETNFQVLTDDGFGIDTVDGFSPTALIAGYEQNGTILYACLGYFQNTWQPGKMHKDWGSCDVSWNGGEHWTSTFQTLVPRFRTTDQNTNSFQIVVAGTDVGDADLGVCRVPYDGGLQVGKYLFTNNSCHIGYGGQEHVFTSGFETLRTANASVWP